MLGDALANGDYGDLEESKIIQAMENIEHSIEKQERIRKELLKCIIRLEHALIALDG